ncbi:hypothetical protein Cni_G27481 [Canna indica]|uniref:Uncharacterized protein n=1 Tax=Canna indica TaxID=4628 RepID=A0AAQ3L1T3_9LILI|nr:hypothetical protein Cni_G27481 [Canna indica]
MAAKAEDAPALPATTPVDSSDLGPRPEAQSANETEGAERDAPPRESKRRRTCPAALETTPLAAKEEEDEESSGALRPELSFSFDTRSGFVTPIETTPKFGCFRFPVADLDTTAAAEAEAGAVEDDRDADETELGINEESEAD